MAGVDLSESFLHCPNIVTTSSLDLSSFSFKYTLFLFHSHRLHRHLTSPTSSF